MNKVKNIGNLFGLAVMLVFTASSVWAQGGSGRITPTSRGTTKTTKTTTKPTVTKKPVKKPQVTSSTTTRRTTKKPVGTAKTYDYYYSQGLAALDQEDYQKAITNFTSAIRLNARSADAYYNRGLAYLNLESYENAIDDYTKSIQYNPAADAYNNRGLAYEYNGNYKLAADDYRTALRIQPGYELAKNNLARVENEYGGDGDDDGSAGDITNNNNNSSNTGDSEYYAELADEYYDKNDFTNALINYNKAIQLNPNGAGSYVRRGFIYHYTGEVAKAYEDYATAARLNPALKNEAYMKCMMYDSSNDAASLGIRSCTDTINEFPGFSLAYYKRGVAYYVSEDYTRSLQDFTKSIEIRSNFFNSMVYRGLIYSATDRYNLAVSEYTRAIQIIGANDSKAYLSYNNRGASYEQLGNYTQAASDYRKALQLNPNFTTARDNLNKLMEKQKRNY
jgi:tetratricopeptide (TPR) repeat protein